MDKYADTTKKFVEELGLEEGVARMIINSSKLDNVRRVIIRIDNIYSAISEQNGYIQNELERLGNFDNDPDYAEKIEAAKQNIMKKCKNNGYKKTLAVIEQAFAQTLKDIETNPNHSKSALLLLNMENGNLFIL